MNWKSGPVSLVGLYCLFLLACAEVNPSSSLGAAGESDMAEADARLGAAVGTTLDFQTEQLTESVNEFSGGLSLSLPVWRLGDRRGTLTHLGTDTGGENAQDWMMASNASGLPGTFDRPWLARLRTGDGAMAIEYPDGQIEHLYGAQITFSSTVDSYVSTTGGRTESFGVWTPTHDGRNVLVTSANGTRYHFDVGNCFDFRYDPFEVTESYDYTRESLHEDAGHCEPSMIVDIDGNGVRAEYYGHSDQDHSNDTFIPRFIESFTTIGTERVAEGRAYFFLKGDVVGTSPPIDRTDLRFNGCPQVDGGGPGGGGGGVFGGRPQGYPNSRSDAGSDGSTGLTRGLPDSGTDGGGPLENPADECWRHFPPGRTPYDVLVSAIVYPGPSSHRTIIDTSWRSTRFTWDADRGLQVGLDANLDGTAASVYDFFYQRIEVAQSGPRPRYLLLVGGVGLPRQQEVSFAWRTTQFPAHPSDHLLESNRAVVQARSIVGASTEHQSLTWNIHYGELPDYKRETVIAHPTGLTSRTLFHPAYADSRFVIFDHGPRFELSGRVERRELYTGDVWDSVNGRIRPTAFPVRAQDFGYGVFSIPGSCPPAPSRFRCRYIVLPAFEVETTYDQTGSAHAVQSVVTQHRSDLPNRGSLDEVATSGDYDRFGRAPWTRQYAATNTSVTRSPYRCGAEGRPACVQDRLIVTPAAQSPNGSVAIEERYEYQIPNPLLTETQAFEAAAILGTTNLIASVTTCRLDTTCSGSDRLSRTEFQYGASVVYPLPAIGSSTRPHQLARQTEVDVLGQGNSLVSYFRYYGATNVRQRPGALAERATLVRQDAALGDDYRIERLSYDQGGSVPSEQPAVRWAVSKSGEARLSVRVTYNNWNQTTTTEDVAGNRTHQCYDTRGRVVALYLPTDTFQSCASGSADPAASEIRTYSAPNSQRVESTLVRRRRGSQVYTDRIYREYDGLDRVIYSETQDAASRVAQSRSYFQHTNLVDVVSEPYVVSLPNSQFTLGGARQETDYDAFGRLLATRRVNAMGQTVGTVTTVHGDTAADLPWDETRMTDAQGYVTVSRTDVWGRLVQTTHPDTRTDTRYYDNAGRLVRVQQADGLETSATFDGVGRVASSTTPEAGQVRFTYNGTGQIVETLDARGVRVRFQHDGLGRLQRRLSGAGPNPRVELELFYDSYPTGTSIPTAAQNGVGQLTRARFEAGEYEFGYDRLGRPTHQATRLTGLEEKMLVRTIDSAGGMMTEQFETQGQPDYRSLALNITGNTYRVNETVLFGRTIETFGYDNLGRPLLRRLLSASGTVEEQDYYYDDFSRLRGVNTPSALGDDSFAYRIRYEDPALGATARRDNLPSEVEWAGPSLVASRSAYLFSYNSRGRLTNADYRHVIGSAWQNTATNDLTIGYLPSGMGQFQTLSRGTSNGQTSTSTFHYQSSTRRLLSITGGMTATLAYDDAGNVRENSEWGSNSRLGYTSIGRPAYVADGEDRLQYSYDHTGRQVRIIRQAWRAVCPAAGGVNAEGSPVAASRSSQGRADNPTGCYVQVEDRHVVRDPQGRPVAEYRGGVVTQLPLGALGYVIPQGHGGPATAIPGVYYTLKDQTGTTRVILNQQGEPVFRGDYDPFGAELSGNGFSNASSVDSFANYRRQHELDSVIDLTAARVYHPGFGRFLSPDPQALRDSSHHSYTFGFNAPHAYTDPDGEFGHIIAGFLIGGAIGFGVELFHQVSTVGWEKVNWTHVGIASVTGGIDGALTAALPGSALLIHTGTELVESVAKQTTAGNGQVTLLKTTTDVAGGLAGTLGVGAIARTMAGNARMAAGAADHLRSMRRTQRGFQGRAVRQAIGDQLPGALRYARTSRMASDLMSLFEDPLGGEIGNVLQDGLDGLSAGGSTTLEVVWRIALPDAAWDEEYCTMAEGIVERNATPLEILTDPRAFAIERERHFDE